MNQNSSRMPQLDPNPFLSHERERENNQRKNSSSDNTDRHNHDRPNEDGIHPDLDSEFDDRSPILPSSSPSNSFSSAQLYSPYNSKAASEFGRQNSSSSHHHQLNAENLPIDTEPADEQIQYFERISAHENQDGTAAAAGTKLRKCLTWRDLVFLGVGSTIGAGIFTVTGLVAATKTGPALFLSYIVSGFACLLSALSYAEFAAMSPTAGSAYAYARGTGGELLGWIIGFDLTLEYSVAAATVAQGWSKTLVGLLDSMGGKFPYAISNPPWQFDSESGAAASTGAAFDLIAMLITFVTTAVLMIGIKESSRFNNAMVCVKVSIILFVIIVGIGYIDSSNYSPFAPHGLFGISFFGHAVAGKTDSAGNSVGVLAGSAYVFFSYIGFDAVTTNAEECVNPQRDLPIGILGSLGISTLLYVTVSIVLTGMVPYNLIDRDNPFTKAFKMVGLDWAEFIIGLGALAGLGSVLLVTLLGQPRILLAMSRDGLLPNKVFNEIHPVYQTPFKSQALTGILVSFLAGFIPEQLLVELVSIGTLFAFMVVNLAVVWLRYAKPELHRPFKCPWVPAIPIGGALICLLLMLSLPSTNWLRLFGWLAVGLSIYYFWGKKNAARLATARRMQITRRAREQISSGSSIGSRNGEEKKSRNSELKDTEVELLAINQTIQEVSLLASQKLSEKMSASEGEFELKTPEEANRFELQETKDNRNFDEINEKSKES